MNQLEQLKQYTTIVADTGDLASIAEYKPEDATTNPSLVLKAVQSGQFDSQIKAIADKKLSLADTMDEISVNVGNEILQLVPGYVSTEVDARLSFDQKKTEEKARKLIGLYEVLGWSRERILIKVASTWEGIRAAETLEKEGIRCNLTLLFGMGQAMACADAGVTLISPFVGRILDWYKASTGEQYTAETDPGVLSVKQIYQHYKQHGYGTIVMGASFRNKEEILALSGCDRLTIAPALLQELQQSDEAFSEALVFDDETQAKPEALSESNFRFDLNQNAMATEKLAEGIRGFVADQIKLEALLKTKYA
ncbi:MAG: transaldolase [Reinekea sp.]